MQCSICNAGQGDAMFNPEEVQPMIIVCCSRDIIYHHITEHLHKTLKMLIYLHLLLDTPKLYVISEYPNSMEMFIILHYWTLCHTLLITAMQNINYRTSWFSCGSIIWHFHAIGISYGLIIKQRRHRSSRWCTERLSWYWKILIILKMWPRMELAVLLTTIDYANIISCFWFHTKRGKNLISV